MHACVATVTALQVKQQEYNIHIEIEKNPTGLMSDAHLQASCELFGIYKIKILAFVQPF